MLGQTDVRAPKLAMAMIEFPVASETFVTDHALAMLARGWHVDLFPNRAGSVAAPEELRARIHLAPAALPAGRWARRAAVMRYGGLRALHHRAALRVLARSDPRQRHQALRDALRFSRAHYDVVHCHFGHRALQLLPLYACGLLRAPLVVTFHGYDLQGFLATRPASVYAPLFAHARSLVATGPYMRELLLSLGARAESITTIANGVKTDRIAFQLRRPPPVGSPLRVLSISRLVEKKDIGTGLQAVAEVLRSGVALKYVVVGDGPLRATLAQRCAELGISDHVEFLGELPHELALEQLAAAHVYMSPGVVAATGDVETQGVALMEAMAAGLPIVATRVGGVPYTAPDGEVGLLAEPGNPGALAAALLAAVRNPERWVPWGEAGRRRVSAEFDQARNMDALAEHYRALMRSA